jgi:hypothetical protein
MKTEKELEYELDCKVQHIININKNFKLRNADSLDNAILASTLWDTIKDYGLHCLPLRVLYDLDLRLSRIANNQTDYIRIERAKNEND